MADKPKTPEAEADSGPSPENIGKSTLARMWEDYSSGKLEWDKIPPKYRLSIRRLQDADDPARLLPFSAHVMREPHEVRGERIHFE